ncbi:benzylsuccinyl-CoA dehydrogenase [Bordetella genomosp. 7]|uniref:Medium-chain specific acyl-CoA dehydrogenase, mitochondrial n=1 Tax=Bordetella genomosp. 7 TaxID=1416805 RepID=A0A261QVF1_9BORD|nr:MULTISPECIES: acyl-CoA dehydrogenase family protein [Bordetella]OZI16340.1 benzylsuccinyl-CoA dehydrogenase [Bordetella genomosp. 7]OZI17045.1 benzylsuccinyl-CoA dehydrogenase [Bordetella genomosp. 7]
MDFELPESSRMVRDTVARFVQQELVGLEPLIIRREAERGYEDTPLIPPDVEAQLQQKARDIGLWGIDVPEEFGGQDLGMLNKCLVVEQLKHSIVPFVLPPESPNLFLLKELCKGSQVDRYLLPYSRGEKKSCLALSEPGAGSDAAAIKTRAERKNGKWVLNGTKLWISNARRSDFMIVMAVTDPSADKRSAYTAFLVDKGTPGLTIPTSFPMIGEYHPYEVVLDNVELDDDQVLGEVGGGFAPISKRLGVRRLEIASRCLGLATRCLTMMIEQANTRKTFGAPLADRQAVQWWIADSYQEIEMLRWVVYQMAWKMDNGRSDVRLDGSMVKLQGTEMIARVVDRAIQLFGGMGVSKEMPLEYISRMCRVMRIVEGPSEVHRWVIARDLLKNGLPAV